MKILLTISGIAVAVLLFGQLNNQIRIGKFTYRLKKEYVFLKDDGLHSTFQSVYTLKGSHQAGFIIEAKKNDSIFIKGNYTISGNKLTTREYYHFNQSYRPDSVIKTFTQQSNGTLKLKSYLEYKAGQATERL
jgi:hypothetical protein